MGMKYKWSMRKYWKNWIKRDFNRWFYKTVYGFNMDSLKGTMLPSTGKGKFVSTYTKGKMIQIKHEKGYDNLEFDEIRIIPCKENHGIMVERFSNGVLRDRNLMDLNQFNKSIIFASNVEQLTNRKNRTKNDS
jgi:hypothetical protein